MIPLNGLFYGLDVRTVTSYTSRTGLTGLGVCIELTNFCVGEINSTNGGKPTKMIRREIRCCPGLLELFLAIRSFLQMDHIDVRVRL